MGCILTKIFCKKQQGRVYKIVLTGGPCAGKTTAQKYLTIFFQNIGWNVIQIPELTPNNLVHARATLFEETEEESFNAQNNYVQTMVRVENLYFQRAERSKKNCLIICDRAVMDVSIYIPAINWWKILEMNHWNYQSICCRYDYVFHLETAAKCAENFYLRTNRSESLKRARELDDKIKRAWRSHPQVTVIDNSNSFYEKILEVFSTVCDKFENDSKRMN